MKREVVIVAIALAIGIAGPLAAADSPLTVSPGGTSAVMTVESRCPTFSWGQVPGVKSYNLVVYQIDKENRDAGVVLSRRLPGSVTSWTPPLDLCLERGGRYAWSVETDGGAPSAWSTPRLFAINDGPTTADFEEALGVVRRYLAAQDEVAVDPQASNAAEVDLQPEAEHDASRAVPAHDSQGSGKGNQAGPAMAPKSYGATGRVEFDANPAPEEPEESEPTVLAPGDGGLILPTGGLLVGTDQLALIDNGRVGIGRTTATFKLDIAGGTSDGLRSHSDAGSGMWAETGTGLFALVARNNAPTGNTFGVWADSNSANGTGVFGLHNASTGTAPGVRGTTSSGSSFAVGVLGEVSRATTAGGNSAAVRGLHRSTTSLGIGGWFSQEGSGWGLYSTVAGGGRAVYGRAMNATGVSYAGYFVNNSSDGTGVYITARGQGRDEAALRVNSSQTSQGMASYMTNNSSFATAHLGNGGTGQVIYLTNGGSDTVGTNGGDFIQARNEAENDIQFRVTTSGQVRSDVGFSTPAADFAEMVRAAKGLVPGDVLAIGSSGKLVKSTRAFQTSVVGVYSTEPGFLGGQPVDEVLEGHAPLALVGIVPVKVTARNGAIRAGDMLVASGKAGHAMRAGSDPPQGSVIGKALEPLSDGTGVIEMFVLPH